MPKRAPVLPFRDPKHKAPPVTRTRPPAGGLTISISLDADQIARTLLRELRNNPDGRKAVIRKLEAYLNGR